MFDPLILTFKTTGIDHWNINILNNFVFNLIRFLSPRSLLLKEIGTTLILQLVAKLSAYEFYLLQLHFLQIALKIIPDMLLIKIKTPLTSF